MLPANLIYQSIHNPLYARYLLEEALSILWQLNPRFLSLAVNGPWYFKYALIERLFVVRINFLRFRSQYLRRAVEAGFDAPLVAGIDAKIGVGI